MKKGILLFAAIIISILAFKSVISSDYESYQTYVDPQGFTPHECVGVSTAPDISSSIPIDCNACCAQGRWVSTECAQQCNQCFLRSDSGSAEANDYPK